MTGFEIRQRQLRGVGWDAGRVEKRVSPLRRQKCRLR
jgi:hypothetical protein